MLAAVHVPTCVARSREVGGRSPKVKLSVNQKTTNHIIIYMFALLYYSPTGKTVNTRDTSGMLLCCKKKANQAWENQPLVASSHVLISAVIGHNTVNILRCSSVHGCLTTFSNILLFLLLLLLFCSLFSFCVLFNTRQYCYFSICSLCIIIFHYAYCLCQLA